GETTQCTSASTVTRGSTTTFRRRSTPTSRACSKAARSEEHTSELQSHRDLHSFPTRCSSDLEKRHNARQLLRSHAAVPQHSEGDRRQHRARARKRRDRKSTRLNSSPTEICTLSLHDALPIWRNDTMHVSFYGHTRQYHNIQKEIDANIARVLESG